ncbi:MAG: membrane protein insertion efficiency factor YidD [Candidatus Roizmanbacteria bacterium]
MTRQCIIYIIRLYQHFEPVRDFIMRSLHFPRHTCKYDPTCSENMIIQIRTHGSMKGIVLGVKQILSCH